MGKDLIKNVMRSVLILSFFMNRFSLNYKRLVKKVILMYDLREFIPRCILFSYLVLLITDFDIHIIHIGILTD